MLRILALAVSLKTSILFPSTGEIPDFKAFSKESKANKEKRKRLAQSEAREAEAHAKELGLDGSESALKNAIMQRQVIKTF